MDRRNRQNQQDVVLPSGHGKVKSGASAMKPKVPKAIRPDRVESEEFTEAKDDLGEVVQSPVTTYEAQQYQHETTGTFTEESVEKPQEASENAPEGDSDSSNRHLDVEGIDFEEKKPITISKTFDSNKINIPLSAYNYPVEVMAQLSAMSGKDLDSDDDYTFLSSYAPNVIYSDRLTRKSSKWTQGIDHKGSFIGGQRPRIGNGGDLKGLAAIEAIRKRSGNGTTITFPLIHSGIWITLRPSNETENVDLDFKISMERIQVGMSTSGLLLNARSGTFSSTLIEFILDHAIDTNVVNLSEGMATSLINRIDSLDYSTLMWGMLTANNPDGHPYQIKCVNPKCNSVHDEVKNFGRMLWMDKSVLSEKQLDMLVKNRNSITDEEIEAYQNEFKISRKNYVTLGDGIKIHFRRCTLAEYCDTSKLWIDEIERSYNQAVTNYATEAQRRSYLSALIQARRMRKYEHMVEYISIDEVGDVTDQNTIREALMALTSNNADYDKFETAAMEFIEDNTLAIVGYVATDCEVCKTPPENAGGRFKSIVPIATDRVFFYFSSAESLTDDGAVTGLRSIRFTDRYDEDRDDVEELLSWDYSKAKDFDPNYVTASVLLRESYDKTYGLNTGRVLANQVDEEKTIQGSLFSYWCRVYRKLDIGTKFGLSLNEYLDYPRAQILELNRCANADDLSDLETGRELMNQIKGSGKGKKNI